MTCSDGRTLGDGSVWLGVSPRVLLALGLHRTTGSEIPEGGHMQSQVVEL